MLTECCLAEGRCLDIQPNRTRTHFTAQDTLDGYYASISTFRKTTTCFSETHHLIWTVVLEKTLESPLDCNIKPVNPKGNQPWIFIGRTDAEAEAPTLWPPDAKSWLTEKDPDAGKGRRQEERGNRGRDGWMASPAQWTWVWASSRRWWRTGKPGVLQSPKLQRVRHDWATEQQSNTQPNMYKYLFLLFSELHIIINPHPHPRPK